MIKSNRSIMLLSGIAVATGLTAIASPFWGLVFPEGALPETVAPQEKISKSFKDARASEVFDWLKSLGLNFVIDSKDISNRRVTLSVEGADKVKVLEAVADALGYTWTKKDGIHVFKKASPFEFQGGGDIPHVYRWEGKPFEMNEKERAEFEKSMKDFGGELGNGFFHVFPKNFEGMSDKEKAEFEKKMENWGEEFGKKMGDSFKKFEGKIFENGKARDMTEKERAEFEKSFKVFGDGEGFRFFSNPEFFKGFEKLSDEEKAQLEKEGRVFRLFGDGKDIKPLDPKEWEKLQKELKEKGIDMDGEFKTFYKDLGPMFEYKKLPNRDLGSEWKSGIRIESGNYKKLFESLTSAQKELMSKNGHLKVSDLTAEQIKLLGGKPEGKFEISISMDGKKLTIKSE